LTEWHCGKADLLLATNLYKKPSPDIAVGAFCGLPLYQLLLCSLNLLSGVPSFFKCLLAVNLLSGVPSFLRWAAVFAAWGVAAVFVAGVIVTDGACIALLSVFLTTCALGGVIALVGAVCAKLAVLHPTRARAAIINFFISFFLIVMENIQLLNDIKLLLPPAQTKLQ